MAIEALDLANSLEAALDGDLQHHEGFKVQDDGAADWALRKIAQAKRKLADAQHLADMETSRIQQWLRGQQDEANRTIGYFEGLLSQYMDQVRTADPKIKSHKLPHGALKLRKATSWLYDDEKLLAWLQANHPEFVRTKPEPDKAGLKKIVTVDALAGRAIDPSTGEAIPGVTIDEHETFSTEVE